MKKKRDMPKGTCPDSGRKDYCRSLNQNRSLERVIKGKKKTLKKKKNHSDQKDH